MCSKYLWFYDNTKYSAKGMSVERGNKYSKTINGFDV